MVARVLVLDIGNTDLVFGLFEQSELIKTWRFQTTLPLSKEEYRSQILQEMCFLETSLQAVVIASVVPNLSAWWISFLQEITGLCPLVVRHDLNLGLTLDLDSPHLLGHDRLANAVAAYHLYQEDMIVVDLGTATTLDVITAEGVFQGGMICPGLKISADALCSQTAQLPAVPLETPKHLVGKNTQEALQSGLIHGHCAMIETLVSRLEKEFWHKDHVLVILTGGLCSLFTWSLSNIVQQGHLTLKGLDLIHRKNC